MLQYYPQWLAEELLETQRKLTVATMELEEKRKRMEGIYNKYYNYVLSLILYIELENFKLEYTKCSNNNDGMYYSLYFKLAYNYH